MNATQFLTLPEQLFILNELLPLFDRVDEFEAELRRRGFDSFDGLSRSVDENASSAEIELARCINLESGKEKLFAWPHHSWAPGEHRQAYWKHGYHSSLLAELKKEIHEVNERECPGVPSEKLPGWRRQISPLTRRSLKEIYENPAAWRQRFALITATRKQHRQIEAKRHATELSSTFEWNREGCRELYAEVMLRGGNALGFKHDPCRSGKGKLFFSKSLTSMWDICFQLGKITSSPEGGTIKINLVIVPKIANTRPRSYENGDFMFIEYSSVVPYFGTTYQRFESRAELETSIIAHLALYELEMSFVEGRLNALLPQ